MLKTRWLIPLTLAALWPGQILSAPHSTERDPSGVLEASRGGGLEEAHPDPQQARGRGGDRGAMYKAGVEANWFDGNRKFWYRNDLSGDRREFILVDAEAGTRRPAFDHAAVAEAMGTGVDRERLPIRELKVAEDGRTFVLEGPSSTWELDLDGGALRELTEEQTGADGEGESHGLTPEAMPRPSAQTGAETLIRFDNRLDREVEVFWLDSGGGRQSYGTVAAGSRKDQHTYAGHVWLVADADEDGETLAVFEATEEAGTAVIDGTPPPQERERRPRRGGQGRSRPSDSPRSPDGQWIAFVRDHNVFIRPPDEETEEIQLSRDGTESDGYRRLSWSPDSSTVIGWRVEAAERKDVYLIRSSPNGGGRATLETRPYALPGDPFPRHELNLFDVETRAQTKPAVDRFEHEWLSPDPHWWPGTTRFAYTQDDRGHQRYRVIEVDIADGSVRHLIDDRTDTFIWTTHMEGPGRLGLRLVTYLDDTREILYASERDGWRHLYLVDADADGTLQQITRGEWVVRGIDRVDEENRQIWFQAGGMNPDQDPYLLHSYRIRFDGTDLTALTEGHGQHRIEYSPDERFLIDTYSRVDLPPVTELRRVSDGARILELEQADISELEADGWKLPEVFTAKGRDGVTDIWGILVRPKDLDPTKKYPIIEDIYAGPQGSFVPKTFSPSERYRSLTDLGFVVVKIDGMGTANRSKAFHDVCFKNLKDGGFEDRILWMKAAAEKYPYLDLDNVGIYGTSAGGQNAAGAVLFHPEFYKAAAANCGCHDNRMDKASWNEQWMGFMPADKIYENSPDNWYAQNSNIEHADKLQGALMLCVGEVDTNVPPESTLRLADALIRANKIFDLIYVPNGGHGAGGAYYQRRMQDFFQQHLQNTPPQNRNQNED